MADVIFCSDPEKNWDRNKVKGLVANLFIVTDVCNATALEVVAGGRLYNIVVDTEVSSKWTDIFSPLYYRRHFWLPLYVFAFGVPTQRHSNKFVS